MVSQFDRRAEDLFRQAEWACNRPFLGAAMAAAALVACADGSLTLAKRKTMATILKSMEARGAVDPAAASNLFNSFVNGIRSQPELGRSVALRAVAAVSGDTEGAQRLLRICRAVSDAQGGAQWARVPAVKPRHHSRRHKKSTSNTSCKYTWN